MWGEVVIGFIPPAMMELGPRIAFKKRRPKKKDTKWKSIRHHVKSKDMMFCFQSPFGVHQQEPDWGKEKEGEEYDSVK